MNISTTIHRMVAASAVAALGLAASAMTTSSYVQDGLVAMWDGNENAGDGQGGHAETLTEWKDTSGRYSFVFNANSGITVEEGALVFPGTDAGYATLNATATDATFEAARNGTCEVVLRADPSKTTVSIALQSSRESGIALGAQERSSADEMIAELRTSTDYYAHPFPSYDWFSAVSTLSTTYSSAQPQNTWGNAKKLTLPGNNTWGGFDSATYLGFRANKTSGHSFKGKIYAIRLYSRQLTAAEIAANRAVDEERFVNGRYGSADLFSISGVPEQFAASEPGYGLHQGYAAGDTEKVKVPAVWTNEMKTVVATCKGWKLYDDLGELRGSGESNVCDYTHPTPAAFRNLVWEWEVSECTWKVPSVLDDGAHTKTEGEVVDGSREEYPWGEAYLLDDHGVTNQIVRVTAVGEDAKWTVPAGAIVEYLLVGGGGSGGWSHVQGDNNRNPGGGGAGAVVYDFISFVADTELTMRVGAGGAASTADEPMGHTGEPTRIFCGGEELRRAPGGGGGAASNMNVPGESSMGSGGGGHGGGSGADTDGGIHLAGAGTASGAIGHEGRAGAGTWVGGGGGGAGARGGGTGSRSINTNDGGAGTNLFITGVETWYAGGGAAEYGLGGSGIGGQPRRDSNGIACREAVPNTGSGGYAGAVSSQVSGAGASGVIVLRYPAYVVAAGLDLSVSAIPSKFGKPSPDYGGAHFSDSELPIECTVPQYAFEPLQAYESQGYRAAEGASNFGDLVASRSRTFEAGGIYRLQWEWQLVGYRLALMDLPSDFGTLTVEGDQIGEGFYRTNTVVTLTAKGDLFGGWAGDVPPGHEMDNPLRLTMDSPKSVWVRSTAWVYDEDARTISDGSWTFSVSGARDNLVVGFPKAKGTTTVIDLNRPVLGGGTLTGISDYGSTSDQCWLSQTVPEIRDYVTEIRFADTMRTIPHAAVRGCAALRSVTLPKEVERIEYGAISELPSLTTVLPAMLPKSLTYLGSNAFKNTPNLNADVVLSNNQLTLQDNTLPSWSIFESSGIVSLDLSAKVRTVPFEFLRRSSKLEKVSYPKTLEALSGAMHADCTGLMDIQFRSYPTNFEAKTDAFYRTPDTGRIVYPKGDSGWTAYLDAHTNDNFTAWDPASPEAQRYLQDFPDGWKPIGRMRVHEGATYGNTYKWMVPHNFGKGIVITFW